MLLKNHGVQYFAKHYSERKLNLNNTGKYSDCEVNFWMPHGNTEDTPCTLFLMANTAYKPSFETKVAFLPHFKCFFFISLSCSMEIKFCQHSWIDLIKKDFISDKTVTVELQYNAK